MYHSIDAALNEYHFAMLIYTVWRVAHPKLISCWKVKTDSWVAGVFTAIRTLVCSFPLFVTSGGRKYARYGETTFYRSAVFHFSLPAGDDNMRYMEKQPFIAQACSWTDTGLTSISDLYLLKHDITINFGSSKLQFFGLNTARQTFVNITTQKEDYLVEKKKIYIRCGTMVSGTHCIYP